MASPIVALGASAGGLEALFELFSALPPSTGASFVVIQHLDREHRSLLKELLAKKTQMPVAQIEEGQELLANHVYVIPPNTSLKVEGNRFRLAPRDTSNAPHHPVDVFFMSMATSSESAAIGVVLSGGDSDGALGVKSIKDHGGITFAQTPASTKFPNMPQNAIDSGCVDFVLRPAEIANEIARLTQHSYLRTSRGSESVLESEEAPAPEPARANEAEERNLSRVFRRLRSAHGVDFRHYKKSTLRRRLSRRMALKRMDEIGHYVDALEDDKEETRALYQDFLIRVTGFFRDAELYEGLQLRVFPEICNDARSKDPIRIWVAGCATGEEVYSIAIALMEYMGDPMSGRRIQIFGTDVSESAIEIARAGVYPENIASEVSAERLARFFVREQGRYHVAKRIRDLCIFARHDVTRDPPFSRIELLSCRNLLIYLDGGAQRQVMRAFHYALSPRGFLALGLSESVGGATDLFELLDKRYRVYSRKASAGMRADDTEPGKSSFTQSRLEDFQDRTLNTDADSVHREADRVLIARYSPPSLLVDASLNILQFRGETGPYVEHASGPPSMNLHRVVRPQLLVEISPAIQEARDSGAPVWRHGLRLGDQTDIGIGVIPLRAASAERSFLIIFESASLASARSAQNSQAPQLTESGKDQRIAQLERELESTREFLQTTMEEQEAVREDLKSAHEEVLSANEEFQSTNEELETAKEELQSTNEELTTTNDELNDRNRELSSVNGELQRTREISMRAQKYADAIVASVRDPLLVLDRELRVLRGNDAFYLQFGLIRESTEGRTLRDLDGRQWDLPALLVQLARVLAQNVSLTDHEIRYRKSPIAAPRILRVDARIIPGDSERGELLLLGMEDVTDRRSQADALALVSQRKDEVLAMLAHELRNPLTPISHAVHLLQRDNATESAAKLHSMIARQTRRLVRLVDDLLDLARINRGHIELRNKLVDLIPVIRDAAEAISGRMDERRHQLTVAVPDAPVYVDGDPVRLEQIVSNLLENAAKYTEPGGRIAVTLTHHDGQAVLSVRDSGIGLAPDDLGQIFDLFNQVDRSLSRSGGGLGIGLTLVRRVLELHGGTVEARSSGIGHGSEFIVRLPLSEKAASAEMPPIHAEEVAQLPAPRRRVLIIDDNVDAAESLKMLAEDWGHEIAVAHDGPQALATVEEFHPEIALVDIGLPGMDGYEIARALRASHPEMFLVAVTGYGSRDDRTKALAAGFDAHLVKPANFDELEAMLAKGRVAS